MDNEKNTFLAELKHYLNSHGKNYTIYPTLAGKRIDLHELYNKVISYGGYQKVSKNDIWHNLVTDLFQTSSDSLSYGLRDLYSRYLEKFERSNFFGEEDLPSRHSDSSRYRGFQDHRHVNFSASTAAWKNARPCAASFGGDKISYDNLVHSLICCLPNEVDFAINNCTLLSGESRHVLRLPSCPRILNALLLHAGIVSDGVDSLREISEELKRKTGHDFELFWRDTVKNRDLIKRVFPRKKPVREEVAASCSSDDESVVARKTLGRSRVRQTIFDEDDDLPSSPGYDKDLLFRPRRAEGVQEYEGQRVLQAFDELTEITRRYKTVDLPNLIAMVLLNLSFENFNVTLLAKSKPIMNFVSLCLHSNYSALRQTGLDIFSNLSSHVDLHLLEYDMNSHLYDFMLRCISSPDKFEIVRGFELLGNLCRREGNLGLLCVHLDEIVFTTALECLLLPDIELVLAALEMIYRLSQLASGNISDRIALIPNSIDILVCLISLNVRQFKSESFAKIRLARKVPPNHIPSSTPQKGPMGRPFSHPADRHISPRPGSVPPGHHQQQRQPPPNSFQMRATNKTPVAAFNPHAPSHGSAMPTQQQQQRLQQHPMSTAAPAITPSPYNIPPQRHAPPSAHHPPPLPPPHVVQPSPTPPRYPMTCTPPPPSTPTTNRVPIAQHPNLSTTSTVPAPNSQLQRGGSGHATVTLSKPSDAGPMYTHSEMRAAPPIFHYMPAPPSTIALDQKSPESFAKLWLWSKFTDKSPVGDSSQVSYGALYAEYKQAVYSHELVKTCHQVKVLSFESFSACLLQVFPKVATTRLLPQSPHPAATDGSTTGATAAQQTLKGIRRMKTPLPVPGYQLRIGVVSNEFANNAINSASSTSEEARKINLKRSINQTEENNPNNNALTKEKTSTTTTAQNSNNHVEEVPAKRLKPDDGNPAVAKMKSEQEIKMSVIEDDKAANVSCKIVSDNSSVVRPIASEMVNGFAVEKNGGDVHAVKQQKEEPEKALDADERISAAANAVQKLAPSVVEDIARVNDDKQTAAAAPPPMGNGVSTPPPNDNNDKNSVVHGCDAKLHVNSTATVAPTAKVTLTNGIIPHGPVGVNHHGTATLKGSISSDGKTETNCNEPMQVDSPAVVQTTQHQDTNKNLPQTTNDRQSCPLVTEETATTQQQQQQEKPQTTNSKLPLSNLASRVVATAVFSNPSKSITVTCPPHASQKETVKSPVTPLPGNPPIAATAVVVPPIISVQFPPGSSHHYPHHHRVVPQAPHQIPAAIRLPPMSPSKPPPHSVVVAANAPIHVQTKYGVIAASPQVNVNQYHHQKQQQPPHAGGSTGAGKANMQIDLMAPDASVMVLYRNCGKPDFTDFMDHSEDPLSVSIRLTSVLILINIAQKSSLGKSLIAKHRNKIIGYAMSGMDCSSKLARLLYEIRYSEGEKPITTDDEEDV